MLFNVFSLVNTWHALGFSVFLMVKCCISNCWNIKCSINAMVQIGMLLRVGF